MSSSVLTVRMSSEEKRLVGSYAKAYGISVSELVRQAVMERIEDEIDARDLMRAIEEDDGVRYSMEDVMTVVTKGE